MKRTTFITLMIISLNYSYSQKKEIKNSIKFNAITSFKQVYDFQYEKVIDNKNSVQFGIAFGNYENNDINKVQELHSDNFGRTLNNPKDGLITEKTFSINVDYRHYYMKTTSAPRGLYLSPSIQYLKSNNTFSALEQNEVGNVNGTFNYTKREYKQNLSLVNIRALIGCQLIIANLVSFNPYIGPSYAFGNAKAYNGNEDTKAKGLLFNYGIYLGVAF
jgi:hypothetical protein